MSSIDIQDIKEISQHISNIRDISYIANQDDHYTIGTLKYDEKIAQYLDKTVENWVGKEADLTDVKKKKGKSPQNKKVAYLWKIPLTNNNRL